MICHLATDTFKMQSLCLCLQAAIRLVDYVADNFKGTAKEQNLLNSKAQAVIQMIDISSSGIV